jgi:hypothetical protein
VAAPKKILQTRSGDRSCPSLGLKYHHKRSRQTWPGRALAQPRLLSKRPTSLRRAAESVNRRRRERTYAHCGNGRIDLYQSERMAYLIGHDGRGLTRGLGTESHDDAPSMIASKRAQPDILLKSKFGTCHNAPHRYCLCKSVINR